MEKNTVMVDLDRYEELLLSEQDFRFQLSDLQDIVDSRFLISKDSFKIEEDDGYFKLIIETKALVEIIKSIGNYTVESNYYNQISISPYNLKIIKMGE